MTASWILQQSLGTPLISVPCWTSDAGIRGLVYQCSHPEDKVVRTVTCSVGHQASDYVELEVPSNFRAKKVPPGSGLLAQGTDKAGCATLA